MAQSFIATTNPYETPAGAVQTQTPGGGSAISLNGSLYTKTNGGYQLYTPPQATNPALQTMPAPSLPSATATSPAPAIITPQKAQDQINSIKSQVDQISQQVAQRKAAASTNNTQGSTYPIGSFVDQGQGRSVVIGTNPDGSPKLGDMNQVYFYTTSHDANGQPKYTYYNANGDTLATNPIGGNQYENNPEGTPGGQDKLISITNPPTQGGFTNTPLTPGQYNAEILGGTQNVKQKIADLQSQSDAKLAEINQKIASIENGTMPLTPTQQSLIDATKATFDQLREQQTIANNTLVQGTQVFEARTGGLTGGVQTALGNVQNAVNVGKQKIAEIDAKMHTTLATMQQGFQQDNLKVAMDAYDVWDKAVAQKEKTINDIFQVTNKSLTDLRDFTMKQQDQIYERVTKPIQDLVTEVSKNNAPQSVREAMSNSKTVDEAIKNSRGYLQTATGTLGDYLQYQRETESKGLTPMDYQTFKDQQDAKAAKLKANEAYSTAYNTAAGKAAANNALGLNADGTPIPTPTSPTGINGSILSATGLSIPAFNFLTQGTSALTRMTAAQRLQYMNEAQNFLNKNGVDISTFQSQYKALGLTVQANSLRNNQAAVAESEIDATLNNLASAANAADFGSINLGNVAKLWAGQEFNDATVSKYAFHLNQLREEFAMYNAALSGQIDANGNIREINSDDRKVAENIIKDGFSNGSIDGFKSALTASRDKMKTILGESIDNQNKKVWELFGAGDKYQTPRTPESIKLNVDNYVKSNPNEAENIAKMYEVPGATDADIEAYLRATGKIQ